MDEIRIRGARTHNLKNINLDLPREKLVVITGLSGSGKSSLAFDTLYAEGQRRYVESLSAYARQFLQLMEKPDVDLIEGLSPAISIEQKATSHNPRSTVGTVTEIHDYLRLLFARVGTPYCPDHQLPLSAQSVAEMVDDVLALPEGTKLMILAPAVREKKGEHVDLFTAMQAQGFVRFRVDGDIVEAEALPKLKKTEKHNIDVVIDRLKIGSDTSQIKQRIAESFETALRNADGRALTLDMDTGRESLFSSRFACPICNHSLAELEPRLFSFNNPLGACPTCDGLGVIQFFDPKRVVGFPNLSLASGAIKGWDRRNQFYYQMLQSLATHGGFDLDVAFEALPDEVRELILQGSGKQTIPFTYINERGRPVVREHPFEGVIPNLERRYKETDSIAVKEELAKYLNSKPCPTCDGTRLRRDARYVRVGPIGHDKAIYEISAMPLYDTLDWFQKLELVGSKREIAERIVKEIIARLAFLNNVGLDYLSLERSAETLSGGEAQRIRLASQIGSGLTGVMYVLDEPSIGLHQRDNDRLIDTLKHLRDLGNSVLVVEHDEDMIRAADFVVDMGLGAGVHGGHVIASGKIKDIESNPRSLTGQYMSGKLRIATPSRRVAPGSAPSAPIDLALPPPKVKKPKKGAVVQALPSRRAKTAGWLRIRGASGNNLKQVDLDIPVGLLVCITGVSGSGKSTLINDTLYHAAARHLYGSSTEPAPYASDRRTRHLRQGHQRRPEPDRPHAALEPGDVHRASSRRSARCSPRCRWRASAATDRGASRSTSRAAAARSCQGDGVIKVEMHFLPDVYVPCDVCHGKRYNRETLEVQYKGKNITEVLDLTVEDAFEYFKALPVIARKLQTLLDVGLGYIKLGQSATTLSGGEAQRVKLSLELSKRDTGRTLYILDEPTTGLHFHDIAMLLKVIHALRDHGNTVVVIEHNLDVIKTADWIVDLGPEGGAGGGTIVAQGTPEDVASTPASYTGRYLEPILARAA